MIIYLSIGTKIRVCVLEKAASLSLGIIVLSYENNISVSRENHVRQNEAKIHISPVGDI